LPYVVEARLKTEPAEIWAIVSLLGNTTWFILKSGIDYYEFLHPSYPRAFQPKENTIPLWSRTNVCASPKAISCTLFSLNKVTNLGVFTTNPFLSKVNWF
jgi:hypothetical protein